MDKNDPRIKVAQARFLSMRDLMLEVYQDGYEDAGKCIVELEAQTARMTNMLEDVVNELDLSAGAIEQHGPMGTPPAELVRLVLAEKDFKIAALKAGLIELEQGVDV